MTHTSIQGTRQGMLVMSWDALQQYMVHKAIHTKASAVAAEGSCCRHGLWGRCRKATPKSWHGWHCCRISPKCTHNLHGRTALAKHTIISFALTAAGNKGCRGQACAVTPQNHMALPSSHALERHTGLYKVQGHNSPDQRGLTAGKGFAVQQRDLVAPLEDCVRGMAADSSSAASA